MVKMSAKWRKERGRYYYDAIQQAWSDTSGLRAKRDKIRELYFKEPGGFDSLVPWEGASDIHLPLITDKIETAVPKLVSSVWRADPFVNVATADGNSDSKAAKNVESFLSWAFRNDIPDFYLTYSNSERNKLLDGTSFLKIRWDRSYRKTIEVHTIPVMLKPGDADMLGEEVTEARDKTIDELMQEVFGFGDPNNTYYDYKKTGKDRYKVEFTEDGEKMECQVEIHPGRRIDEVDVKIKRMVLSGDNPEISNVDFEDLLFPVRAETLQKAKWVAHRTWYPVHEVRRMRNEGKWVMTDDEFDTITRIKVENNPDSTSADQKDKVIEVTANTGTGSVSKDGKADPNMIMIWELYVADFVDDDEDYPTDLVMYIPDSLHTVIGIEYQDEMLPHGRRPFVSDNFIPIDGRVYGIGMAELLYGINLSVDKTINQVNNAVAVKSNPWAIYSAYGLAGNSRVLSGIKPGEWLPVGDVNAIKFPDFAQEPLQMFHASFDTLLGYADSLTFSPTVAGNTNFRNAPRTARGTLAMMDASEEKLSSLVEKSQATSWKEMVRQVASLYAAYIGIDKWYRVTGEAETRRISPRELRQNWQFEYTGSLTSVNREVQQALAERRYMALRVDPLYQQDPKAHQALVDDYLQHMTTGKDHKSMVPQLAGEGGYPHPPMTQKQELRILTEGQMVEVLPIDDHEQHLQVLEKFIMSDAFEAIPSYAVAVIRHHLNQHQKAAASAQQTQAQGGGLQGAQGMPAEAPMPGVPVEGMAAPGGEMSMMQGGPM